MLINSMLKVRTGACIQIYSLCGACAMENITVNDGQFYCQTDIISMKIRLLGNVSLAEAGHEPTTGRHADSERILIVQAPGIHMIV